MTRVAALIHFFPPWRNAGSESVAHALLKAAVDAGHEVTVWVTHKDSETTWRGTEPEVELDGIRVVRVRNQIIAGPQISKWKPAVVLTHHQHATTAIKLARQIRARSAFAIHNNFDINRRPMRANPDLTIFNSVWVQESLIEKFGKPKESMTFHPPVMAERHLVDSTGDAITLVNLNSHKGSTTFYELAAAEPNRQFIGVVGGHGVQIVRRNLKNVTIVEHSDDMRPVWAKTRVLLMPSVQESYGLVAVEAGLNGIPTIAHPTDGLLENLGPGGLFADRDSVAEWSHLLRTLDGQFEYGEASEYARTRAADAIDATRGTLKKWVEWIG